MEHNASYGLLGNLFEEYSDWYVDLADLYGSLPRSISGVAENGQQFIYLLDDLELHHMIRNKFLRFVLDECNAVAYAYAGVEISGDSNLAQVEEVLNVVVADSHRYIIGAWQVIRREDGTVADLRHMGNTQGDDPENHPGSWLLCGSVSFPEAESAKFSALWNEVKPGVVFKDRNATD